MQNKTFESIYIRFYGIVEKKLINLKLLDKLY
jgi:hypothetical protein